MRAKLILLVAKWVRRYLQRRPNVVRSLSDRLTDAIPGKIDDAVLEMLWAAIDG